MKIGILKEILKQYDDNDLIFLFATCGTVYRMEKDLISGCGDDGDLYEIKNAKKDEKVNALVLYLE